MDEAAMTSPKVVLLDRDGVINRDRPCSVLSAADFELIPGSLAALIALTRAGWQVAVVTNQACIGRGAVAASVVDAIHAELATQVVAGAGVNRQPLQFFVSASADPADPDRKPNPGLIHRAHAALTFERATTWLVGDDQRDVLAARAAGVKPALVLTGKGSAAHAALSNMPNVPDVPVFADLQTFATALIAGSLP